MMYALPIICIFISLISVWVIYRLIKEIFFK